MAAKLREVECTIKDLEDKLVKAKTEAHSVKARLLVAAKDVENEVSSARSQRDDYEVLFMTEKEENTRLKTSLKAAECALRQTECALSQTTMDLKKYKEMWAAEQDQNKENVKRSLAKEFQVMDTMANAVADRKGTD